VERVRAGRRAAGAGDRLEGRGGGLSGCLLLQV